VQKLPIIETQLDLQALRWSHLTKAYKLQFRNKQLVAGGLLMGGATCFVYVFAALAPFIAMNKLGMSSEQYGIANILPSVGLILGSLGSAYCAKKYQLNTLIKAGLIMCAIGAGLMTLALAFSLPALYSLFLPMVFIYIGLSFVMSNASSVAMSFVTDKAHGSAVMNFINMGAATIVVFSLGGFALQPILLPMVYLFLCLAMVPMYCWLVKK
jgi:MFS family permease